MKITPVVVKKILRGCGEREEGGLYVRVATSPLGMPLDHFLIDYPKPYNGTSFRVPAFQDDNAFFWVGEEAYPFCPDFIEETKLYGISKRIPLDNALMAKFIPGVTRLLFIHPKAISDYMSPVHACPKLNPEHASGSSPCITTLYHLIDGKEMAGDGGRFYVREIGSTTYTTSKMVSRSGVAFHAGIFMWLPFSHFEYVMPKSGQIDPRIEAGLKNGAPVYCVQDED